MDVAEGLEAGAVEGLEEGAVEGLEVDAVEGLEVDVVEASEEEEEAAAVVVVDVDSEVGPLSVFYRCLVVFPSVNVFIFCCLLVGGR